MHMHNMLLACMSTEESVLFRKFGGTCAGLRQVCGSCLGKYFRAKIEVDMMKPLKMGLRVIMEDPDGESIVVVVSLGAGPWDQLFCGENLPAIAVGGLAAFAGGLLAILAIPRSSAQKPRALT
ncbi:hypothetical protein ACOSP7_027024 [Xanthoceras sorbifolium]